MGKNLILARQVNIFDESLEKWPDGFDGSNFEFSLSLNTKFLFSHENIKYWIGKVKKTNQTRFLILVVVCREVVRLCVGGCSERSA